MSSTASKQKIRVSIDEGGDQGSNFSGSKVSSRFFVFTAVMDADLNKSSVGDVITQIKLHLYDDPNKSGIIHFRELSEGRKDVVQELVTAQSITAISTVIDKIFAYETRMYDNRYPDFNRNNSYARSIYYAWLEMILFELSKYAKLNDLCMQLNIGEYGGMINNKLLNRFIKMLIDTGKIENCFISPRIFTTTQNDMLQVADIVASSIYSAIEPKQRFVSSHGIRMYPIIYKGSNGEILDHGIIFNPGCTKDIILDNYPWMQSHIISSIHKTLFPARLPNFKLYTPAATIKT